MDLEEQKKADYKGQGKLQDVIKIIRMIIIVIRRTQQSSNRAHHIFQTIGVLLL